MTRTRKQILCGTCPSPHLKFRRPKPKCGECGKPRRKYGYLCGECAAREIEI